MLQLQTFLRHLPWPIQSAFQSSSQQVYLSNSAASFSFLRLLATGLGAWYLWTTPRTWRSATRQAGTWCFTFTKWFRNVKVMIVILMYVWPSHDSFHEPRRGPADVNSDNWEFWQNNFKSVYFNSFNRKKYSLYLGPVLDFTAAQKPHLHVLADNYMNLKILLNASLLCKFCFNVLRGCGFQVWLCFGKRPLHNVTSFYCCSWYCFQRFKDCLVNVRIV